MRNFGYRMDAPVVVSMSSSTSYFSAFLSSTWGTQIYGRTYSLGRCAAQSPPCRLLHHSRAALETFFHAPHSFIHIL